MISLVEARDIVDGVDGLPTLPSVVSELLARMEDPNSSVGSITDIIQRDPSISAKILQLVNSAFYGLPHRISSLHNAINVLGFNPVRSAVLAATVFDMFRKQRIGFDVIGFWIHCLGTGVAANALARRSFEASECDSAFAYGLLHDVGKIFMAVHMEKDLAVVLDAVKGKNVSFVAAEQELLGYSHADVGAALAEHWRFPKTMVTAIRFHHRIEENHSLPPEASLIHVGDVMARALQIGWCGDEHVYPVSPVAWKTLGLTDNGLDEVMDDIHRRMIAAESFIDVIHESGRKT